MSKDTTHSTHTDRGAEHLMTMPENHLDAVVSTNSIDTSPSRRASLVTRIVAVVMMPLMFLVVFTLCYTSALHAPKPHDLALTVAGPAETTQRLQSAITGKAAHAFDITETLSAAKARQNVENRSAVGAIIVDGTNVTTVVATGGGALAATTVESVGTQVAAELGGTSTVDDVAPTPSNDPAGTSLFFLVIICTVGGYLSLTVLSQVLPRARTRTMIATAAIAAVLTPIIGFAMISIFVGDYGATFGEIAAVLGIGMLYTFTVGLIATIFTKLLKQAAILGVLVVLMGLNFPSAGGGSPESMLPGFWQVIHNGWVGAGTMESFRSIIDFNGHQVGRWLGQLGIWTGASFLITVLLGLRGRSRTEPETATNAPAGGESAVAVL